MKRFLLTLIISMFSVFCFAGEEVKQVEKYNNGNIKCEVVSVNYGTYYKYIKYYKTGEICVVGYYNEFGDKHSEWITYYKSGNKASYKVYNNGKKDGEWYFYTESGDVFVKAEYKNDKRHGEWHQYDRNGRLMAKNVYKKGVLKEGLKWTKTNGLVAVNQ